MRRVGVVCCVVLSIGAFPSSASQLHPPQNPLEIRVQQQGWGSAQTEEIETLLQAVAMELLPFFPGRQLNPILVSHSHDNPIVLYDKGPGNEYRIQLCASNKRWPQYVYEFAHELCHVLSNYERHVAPGMSRHHQWFEESLCEAASLYTLRRISAAWSRAAPDAAWAEHAPSFGEFADRFFAEPHRKISSELPLWFAEHQRALSRNPYLRQYNEVVANLMLPLFERHPQSWGALGYLNLDAGGSAGGFPDYLRHWHQVVPAEHKSLVTEVMKLFGIPESSESQTLASDPKTLLPAPGGPAGSSGE
jgi:hypothetical protein